MLTTSSSAIGLPFGDQVAPTEAHLEFMDGHRKSAYDAHHRAEAFILPQLGDIEVSALTTERIRKWHIALAQAPARMRSPKNGNNGTDSSARTPTAFAAGRHPPIGT